MYNVTMHLCEGVRPTRCDTLSSHSDSSRAKVVRNAGSPPHARKIRQRLLSSHFALFCPREENARNMSFAIMPASTIELVTLTFENSAMRVTAKATRDSREFYNKTRKSMQHSFKHRVPCILEFKELLRILHR